MPNISPLLLLLLSLINPIASLSLPSQQPIPNPQNDPNPKTHFRDVQESDIPALTTILVEAFFPSPAWHYLMPDLEHHKPEIWACLHAQIAAEWSSFDHNTTFGKVITVPQNNHINANDKEKKPGPLPEPEKDHPIALAFWNLRTSEDPQSSSSQRSSSSIINNNPLPFHLLSPCHPNPTNLTRALSLVAQQQTKIESRYFHTDYPSQLYLHTLATHPDYDGHGFAARHCNWGMDFARELGAPLTLLSSPAGWPLYDSLAFESVENVTLEMLDGEGKLWFEVMKWEG